MPIIAERNSTEVIAAWRAGDAVDGGDHPAGPLFVGGDHAEQELTMTGGSGRCGTACTNSGRQREEIGIQCC